MNGVGGLRVAAEHPVKATQAKEPKRGDAQPHDRATGKSDVQRRALAVRQADCLAAVGRRPEAAEVYLQAAAGLDGLEQRAALDRAVRRTTDAGNSPNAKPSRNTSGNRTNTASTWITFTGWVPS